MYIIGGKRNGEPVDDVFEIDLKYRTVFLVDKLKTPRYGGFVVSDKKHIYCLGGYTLDGPNNSIFEKYDTNTKEWSNLSSLDPKFNLQMVINDKHFICCFGQNHKEFMKYIIQDDRWVVESASSIPKDILSYTNICMANQSKFTILARAVRESSNLDLLHLDLLTNKIQKHSQLSVVDSWLPLILVPNLNLRTNTAEETKDFSKKVKPSTESSN